MKELAMCWTINTPVDVICCAQFLKQKNFALDANARKVCLEHKRPPAIFTDLLSCSPRPGWEAVLISEEQTAVHECFVIVLEGGGKKLWLKKSLYVDNTELQRWLQCSHCKPTCFTNKYVTHSNHKTKNTCSNLTRRHNFSYYFAKPSNCQGLLLKYYLAHTTVTVDVRNKIFLSVLDIVFWLKIRICPALWCTCKVALGKTFVHV